VATLSPHNSLVENSDIDVPDHCTILARLIRKIMSLKKQLDFIFKTK